MKKTLKPVAALAACAAACYCVSRGVIGLCRVLSGHDEALEGDSGEDDGWEDVDWHGDEGDDGCACYGCCGCCGERRQPYGSHADEHSRPVNTGRKKARR